MSLNTFQQLSPDERQTALDAPALKPPAGMQADFDNPPNRNIIPHVVIPICLILVISTMLLRAYARGTYVAYIYCVYDAVRIVGFFVHQWDTTVGTVSRVEHVLQLGATFYTITLVLVKAAILLQWMRIFAPEGTRGAFYWICQVLLWTNVLFYLSVAVAGNLICVPFERIWDKTVPGVCYNGRPLNMTLGSFNLVSDIFILILPQRIIWRLNMSREKKIGIALIACAAAAFRIGVTVTYLKDTDWLYRVSSLSMGCIAEMTCILLVYNMPGVPRAVRDSPMLSRIFVSLRSSLTSDKDKSIDGFRHPEALQKRQQQQMQMRTLSSTEALESSLTNTSQDWIFRTNRVTTIEQDNESTKISESSPPVTTHRD
ncbi:uncharacterized protein TRUGW13939_00875 [Talaromyces rugulosus]|uniref:Rhodopsin domain-containing protein n=1 Tax=Talaromyces rugulosus TaxID=121627 RepID=A0A7H8QK11_TALRU|nr:uncharacterized protein TRUGW13939_00875 [Talaromyces rugulosus]QKX53795.1 hypothetical protein TRUGW13939_00875 [Talaromyces rugulosus]